MVYVKIAEVYSWGGPPWAGRWLHCAGHGVSLGLDAAAQRQPDYRGSTAGAEHNIGRISVGIVIDQSRKLSPPLGEVMMEASTTFCMQITPLIPAGHWSSSSSFTLRHRRPASPRVPALSRARENNTTTRPIPEVYLDSVTEVKIFF